MKILITCGPSYEPIDQARRMTNFSTGRLGVILANHFVREGHQVICFRGEGSTYQGRCEAQDIRTFSTNNDLANLLVEISLGNEVDLVLHAAALCDYRVERAHNSEGEFITSQKFATRDGHLHLVLSPAMKVLPRMREWFPHSQIVGWKYELVGDRADAFTKAWRQIKECHTDACVLNGAAYGPGFALCHRSGTVMTTADAAQLSTALSLSFATPCPEWL